MDEHLRRVRHAYDLTVRQYDQEIDPLEQVPKEFKESARFQAFMEDAGRSCNNGAPENREFLDPRSGMRFLDAGCAASLANYRLHQWPSTYYGVDISAALIDAMRRFAARQQLALGGLHVAEVAALPFDDSFFDIAAVVGVLEYCTLDYIRQALPEIHRVLKPSAKVVLDIPNLSHPDIDMMFRLEEYLGRPEIAHSRVAFEEVLSRLFAVERVDDSHVMLKYFCRADQTLPPPSLPSR
jgi:SAM-dependent methyltransferase